MRDDITLAIALAATLGTVACATVAGIALGQCARLTRDYASLVARLAERPHVELRPTNPDSPPLSDTTYISDLPYHDELWDEFTGNSRPEQVVE